MKLFSSLCDTKKIYQKLSGKFSLTNYIIVFFVSCFVGWIYETILGFFQFGTLVSKQCILIGTFIPVYGFGAILFMFVFIQIKNFKIFFLISIPLGAILEFLYSYIQEKLFGTVSWEYNNYFLSFQGRTSLVHGIFWGIVGFLFLNYMLPLLFNLIEKFPKRIINVASCIILIFMLFDFTLTILTSNRQNERHKQIEANSFTDLMLDKYYPDEKLNKIYFSHIRKN